MQQQSLYLISLVDFHKSIFGSRVIVFIRMPAKKRNRKTIFFIYMPLAVRGYY
jgi:hypothetical protein